MKIGFRRQLRKSKSYAVPETARGCEENGQKRLLVERRLKLARPLLA
jgi:hypothetical protein